MSQKKVKSRIILPGSGEVVGPGRINPPREFDLTNAAVLELKNAECSKCGGTLFQPCMTMKKCPGVHPGNLMSKNKLIPVSTYYCLNATCGAELGEEEAEGCFE